MQLKVAPPPVDAALKAGIRGVKLDQMSEKSESSSNHSSESISIVAFPMKAKLNPHMSLLYAALQPHQTNVMQGTLRILWSEQYDIVHYHWPEMFLNRPSTWLRWRGLARFTAEMLLIRWKRGRVIWTVQNIKGHEERPGLLSSLFRRILFWNLAGFISLSRTAHEIALETYPELKRIRSIVVPRGHYRDLYPNPPAKEAAKAAMGLPSNEFAIGMVGQIRPYKNIPHLIRCFQRIKDASATLTISGTCSDDNLRVELEQLALADERVRLDFRFIPESELPALMRALDLVILPYTDILNSGAALLALSLDVPVLAPAKGTLIEVQQAVGDDWLKTYEGDLNEKIIEEGIEWAKKNRARSAPLEFFDWETNASKTADFFRTLVPAL